MRSRKAGSAKRWCAENWYARTNQSACSTLPPAPIAAVTPLRAQHSAAGTRGNGAWGYIAGTDDQNGGANNQRLWLNGVVKAEAMVTDALQAGSEGMGIGEEISGVSNPFDGLIDEVRIRAVVRSDAWVEATWRNLSTPASFLYAAPRR